LAVSNRSATNIGAVIKGAPSQTANLTEWQDSSGTILTRVTSSGVLGTSAGVYSPYYQGHNGVGGAIAFANATAITITPQSASVASLIVKGAASQTANLQEWQNSSGTVLAFVDSSGNINTTSKLIAGNILDVTQSSATATGYGTSVVGDKIALFGSTSLPYYYGFGVQNSRLVAYVDSGQAFAVRVASSSGAKSSGSDSVILYGTGAGSFLLNSASTVGLIVKAAASQTADLQQWQNSSGTVLAEITASGSLELNGKDIELMNIMGAF